MSTPYSPTAAQWISESPLEHSVSLSLPGRNVPVKDGTLTYHGTTIPSYTAEVTIPLTEDTASLLDSLDPRRALAASIFAGYRYPDGEVDIQHMGQLYVRDVDENLQDSTISASLASAEALLEEARVLWNGEISALPRTGVPEAVRHIITKVIPTAVVTSEVPDGTGSQIMADLVVELDEKWLDVLEEVTQAADLRLSVDRSGTFRLDRRTETVGAPVATLATGETGTVTTMTRRRSLDQWANVVRLRAPEPGVEDDATVSGIAEVRGGSFGTSTVPRRVYAQRFDRPATVATLNARAATLLRRLFTLGTGFNITAVSAYWLRPDSTVDIKPPDGTTTRQLIRNITFNLGDGTMALSTREDTAPLDITSTEDAP